MTISARAQNLILLCLLVAMTLAGVVAILGRGPWYDEFYTFYVTAPTRSFWASLNQHWLTDNHPPLYYALSWSTGWLGKTIEQRRLLNVLVLFSAAGALGLLLRMRPDFRNIAIPYAISLASFGPAVIYISELRSNFLAYAATGVMVASLAAIATPHTSPMRKRDWIFLTSAMLIAFNVHFVATLICLSVSATFAIWLIVCRDWRRAVAIIAAIFTAITPFAILLALQFSRIVANTRSFWIPAGFDSARWTIEHEFWGLMSDNIILTLAGLVGLGFVGLSAWRARRASSAIQLAVVLGVSGAVAVALLLAIHTWRPIVIARYLVAFAPILGLLLAIGVEDVLAHSGRAVRLPILAGLLAATTISIVGYTSLARRLPSWNGTAAVIAEVVHRCQTTLVHPATHWNSSTLDLPPADNRKVLPMAYTIVAERHGFALEPAASRRMAPGCPTMFWAEHVARQPSDAAEIISELRREGFTIGAARLRVIPNGWVLTAFPAE